MAQTIYQSKVAVTMATRSAAYEAAASLMLHLDHLGLNLISLVRDTNNFIVVTLNAPLPVEQVDHLGLTGPV
jgi:hypothetical protein